MKRKWLVAGSLAVALTAAPAVAWAHECFVVNRSAQGNQGAGHSERWESLTLDTLFQALADPEFAAEFGMKPFTAEQIAAAAAMAREARVPDSFAFRTDKTIGFNEAKEALTPGFERGATDGKGVDHFFTTYGEVLVGIIFAVGEPL